MYANFNFFLKLFLRDPILSLDVTGPNAEIESSELVTFF